MSRSVGSTAVLVAGILLAGVGSFAVPEPDAFGPLAVIEDSGGGQSDALGGTGTVIVGERCVELDVRWVAANRPLRACAGWPPRMISVPLTSSSCMRYAPAPDDQRPR